ncbi:MAG: DUF4402 domain-containing protein [Alphaproteobacteria bacterium]
MNTAPLHATLVPKRDLIICDTNPGLSGGTVNIGTGTWCRTISGTAVIAPFGLSGKVLIKNGTPDEPIDIMFSSGNTLTGPGASIPMHSINHNAGVTPVLNDVGRRVVKIGTAIDVGASQAMGLYTGTYTFSWKHTTDTIWESIALPVEVTIAADSIWTEELDPMNFGTIAADPAGGTILLNTSDIASNVTGVSLITGTPESARFRTTGAADTAFSITLPVSINLTGPGTDMLVNNFIHDAGATPTLSSSGARIFNIGATLAINAAQTAGIYTGTYTINVDY